jgi:hypothetical protein
MQVVVSRYKNTDSVEAVECMKSWRNAGLRDRLMLHLAKAAREEAEVDDREV